jgi:hypothetical protein
MSKRKAEAEYLDPSTWTKFQVIGPPQPHPKYTIYLRIETREGVYVGSLRGAALYHLTRRLARYVLGARLDGRRGK